MLNIFSVPAPVVLQDGDPARANVPEGLSTPQEHLAALGAFDAMPEELTEEQWRVFEEVAQRRV